MMFAKFLRGFMDGSLSTMGIVIGAYAATESVVIAAAVGGAVANGISNALSALSSAEAEQYSKMRDIEDAMVSRELKGSHIEKKIRRETIIAAFTDGLASILGGAIPILPYLFVKSGNPMYIAAGLVILMTFIVGIYLGKVSKRNIFFSAIKMAFFALVIAVAVYFIQSAISR